jgi:hypothetical protein
MDLTSNKLYLKNKIDLCNGVSIGNTARRKINGTEFLQS